MQRRVWIVAAAGLILMMPKAKAENLEILSTWQDIRWNAMTSRVKLTMTDGAFVKARVLNVNSAEFIVGDPKNARHVQFDRVVRVDLTVIDSSFGDYCTIAFGFPLGLLFDTNDASYWLISPILLGWAAGGLATFPVLGPIKYFHGRHTHHYKLAQP
jgi:hypothetical protein